MRYILLLRGINVGGKHKVSMSELKEKMSKSGLKNLYSYINSGNIFFDTDDSFENCIMKILSILEKNYDFSIPFALITKEDYLKEQSELPDWWEYNLARKDVLFFSQQVDKTTILEFINSVTLYNELVYVGKSAIYWGKCDETEYLKTTYHKQLLKQNFYKYITIRNGNTFEKIAEILKNETDTLTLNN